jgi:CrcB protein
MLRFAWICFGGAIGTGVRYLLSGWMLKVLGPSFPYGTFAVNVIGSFLLVAIMHVALSTQLVSPTLRLTLTTGVMGGFTTYSTFSYETFKYLQDGAWLLALRYVGVTVFGCLIACVLGLAAAKWLVG